MRSADPSIGYLVMIRNACLVVFVVALVVALLPRTSEAAPEPGSAGTDTSLPLTDSAATVRGRGAFSDLEITVNQTRNLTSQAISLKWTGGTPTSSTVARFTSDYLQVMQCWGDDDGAVPGNPGPPPEQCVFGAADGTPESSYAGVFPAAGQTLTRIVSRSSWQNHDPGDGYLDQRSGLVWREFRSVDGTVVTNHTDPTFNPYLSSGNYWTNPFFNNITTNELAGARTGPDGTGNELFRIDTGVESSGLGCGQRLTGADGAPFTPRCWLVIVPRGSATAENVGTPYESNADGTGVYTSPLAPEAWANRIAVPLEFNPVDSNCEIGADERRVVGSEMALAAVSNWQPGLCSTAGLPPYTYSVVSDTQARQQVVAPTSGSAGMAVTQRPIADALSDPASPTVYAPVTASGIVIGFNVERTPKPTAEQAEQDLAGIRVSEINLTPRLVAKLLTQSYRTQVDIRGEASPYEWVTTNPFDIAFDPEFVKFNPEFELLQASGLRNLGGLAVPSRNSDLASQVWEWVLADPEAKAWMDGQPDPWGMVVNPLYSTRADGAAFGDPVPDSFPKSDPYCLEVVDAQVEAPALCGTDWMPYQQGLRETARSARAASDGAKVTDNPFAQSPDQFWKRTAPQTIGRRGFLSLTDTASARQYGIQMARLSRAGDDGDDREFVAPDEEGLTQGLEGMVPGSDPTVLVSDPSVAADGAYPLTALTYAAIRPLDLDDPARAEYGAFLDYAAGPGQVSGLQPGELPPGYVALTDDLKAQTAAAAALVRSLQAPPVPEPSPAASASEDAAPPPAAGQGARPSTGPDRRAGTVTTLAQEVAAPVAISEVAEVSSPPAGPLTPILALARNRFFIPVLAGLAVLSTVASLEITKRPRRRRPEVVL